jgi:hypothetical protein
MLSHLFCAGRVRHCPDDLAISTPFTSSTGATGPRNRILASTFVGVKTI